MRLPVLLLTVWLAHEEAPAQGSGAVPADAGDGAPRVVLRFAGDCLLAAHYERAAGESLGFAFEGFDLFRTDDVTVVNFEGPVTPGGTPVRKKFTFRMPAGAPAVLRAAGVDVVTIANNHIHDYGPGGILSTLGALDAAGLARTGAGSDRKEAHTPAVLERAGRRFAFLGYYGGGEAPTAGDHSPGVARRDLARMREDIGAILEQDSSVFVTVLLHWGNEKAEHPEPWQMDLARRIIEAGARAVVGHHPHVLQGIERYRGGIIAYSLGNFLFGGNSRSSYDTAVLELALGGGGPAARLIPVRISNWRASVLEGPDALSVLRHVAGLSRGFEASIFTDEEQR
ncbi:MAG: CapA family protein [Bacteroidota bacterium]